jgi:hypothetical protein
MDAEILFFMSEKDQADFLKLAETSCDSISTHEDIIHLNLGDCSLFFKPSRFEDNILYCGKLEIRIGPSATACKDQERAKSSFRKLRNHIKKTFWSRLAYENKNKRNNLTPSRNHWLGADAKLWKERDIANNKLKLSKTSWMVFELGY